MIEDPIIKHRKRSSERVQNQVQKKAKPDSDSGGPSISGPEKVNLDTLGQDTDVVGPKEVRMTSKSISKAEKHQREAQETVSDLPTQKNSTAAISGSEKFNLSDMQKSSAPAECDVFCDDVYLDMSDTLETSKEDRADFRHAMKDYVVVKLNQTLPSILYAVN